MKKLNLLLCMLVCIFSVKTFAQEVHGVETRRVIYESETSYSNPFTHKTSNKYYGWEVTNYNSFAISIDLELRTQSFTADRTVKTQSIILKAKEKYIFKREEHCSTKVDVTCEYPISSYFLTYKAYKLQ